MRRPLSSKTIKPKSLRHGAKLVFESLESRQMLAAEIGNAWGRSVDSDSADEQASLRKILANQPVAFQYRVGDETVRLAIHPNRVAVRLADAGVRPHLVDSFNLVRPVTDGVAIYESTGIGLQSLDVSLGQMEEVDAAYPVYVNLQTGSEAVLLDELIVALQPGVSSEAFFAGNETFSSYRPLRGTPDQFIATVAAGGGNIAMQTLLDLENSEHLAWVGPNFYQQWQKYFTPNDTRFSNLWHLENTGQGGGVVDADSDLPTAWDYQQGSSAEFVIGVIDDGVDAHPDLLRWTNPGEVAGNGIDDDGNGWVDDINGWNFVANNNVSVPTTNIDNHGTAVAGVAAASGHNNLGVVGASFGSAVMSARMFEGNSDTPDAAIAEAIYYTSGRTADGTGTWSAAQVINNSWGGGGIAEVINTALVWGGTAGNQGLGASILFASGNGFSSSVSYPASQAPFTPGMIAVGATNNFGQRSNYSNFGSALDFVTPSSDTRSGYLHIDTTDRIGVPGYAETDYTGTGEDTGFGGTSSATPLAAGIASLTLSRAAALSIPLTADELRDYLRANTDLAGGHSYDISTGKTDEFGFGRLNAGSALANLGTAEISVVSTTTDFVDGAGVMDFGATTAGLRKDVTLRIRNQGTSPLQLQNATVTGSAFSVIDFVPITLEIGEWSNLVLRATPDSAGVSTGQLVIESNDTNESSFELDLSVTAAVVDIVGSVFEDRTGDGGYDLHESGLSGQRVYIDVNNNSAIDVSTMDFTQNTPTNILDNVTVTSTFNVTGLSGSLTDVNVRINATHTYVSDLDIFLISPAGTRVLLASDIGGSSDNFTNTTFDDEAATSIASAPAPRTGSFRPQGLLSALDGESGNGTWTIEITDFFAGDQGTLLNWTLQLGVAEPFVFTDTLGGYVFDGLADGTYTFRVDQPSGWSTTALGADGFSRTFASPTDHYMDLDFGVVKNNRIYARVIQDLDEDGASDSGELGLSNHQIFLDLNANGQLDAPVSSSRSNLTDVPIQDLVTVTSVIPVTGLSGSVIDVNVRLNITHTYVSDLDVYLVSPSGKRVVLFADVGGNGDNFIDTVLDDEAANSIDQGVPPFTGTFKPQGTLASLDGEFVNGNWTLEVFDDAPTDIGMINEWEILFLHGEPRLLTDGKGNGSVETLPGVTPLVLSEPAGWDFTLPSDGIHQVDVSSGAVFERVFGLIEEVTNQPPTDILLDNDSVPENTSTIAAFPVGVLSAVDPNAGDSHTFLLTSGAGDADNGLFEISGNVLSVKAGVVLNYEADPSYQIRVRATDNGGEVFEKELVIQVDNLAEVSSITVADGTVQRSLVKSVVVEFDGEMTLNAGAFIVNKRGAGGGAVNVNVASQLISGRTVATLTFSGGFTFGGSLVDGNYDLRIDATKVLNSSGDQLDGDRNGVAGGDRLFGTNAIDNFFRLFGDVTGNRNVNIAEFNELRGTFGRSVGQTGYKPNFDFDGNNSIGLPDFNQFRTRFGSSLPFS